MSAAAAHQGIYVASKAVHGPRWRDMRAAGVPIVSTWIDEAEVGATSDWADLWERCIREASSARAVLVYVEEGETLKGALVEAGAGLACGVSVHVVCPLGFDHTFLRHPLVRRHETLRDALVAIARDNSRPSMLFGLAALVEDVTAFCEGCGNKVSAVPTRLDGERQKHRNRILAEEWDETHRGLKDGDLVRIADGLADVIYVAIGTALERGVALSLTGVFDNTFAPGMAGLMERARGLIGLDAPRVPAMPSGTREADLRRDWGHMQRRVVEALTDRADRDGKYLAERLNEIVELALVIAATCGIPLDEVWAEVHRSNMDKIDPLTGKVIRSATGKVLKPEGWVGPDVRGILLRHGWVPKAD